MSDFPIYNPNIDFTGIEKRQEELAGRNDAEGVFKHLRLRMIIFQNDLPKGKELGIRVANFGLAAELHVRQISYRNPNLIEFTGIFGSGEEVLLTQHISQLNFFLIAMSPLPEQEPYRVGFAV